MIKVMKKWFVCCGFRNEKGQILLIIVLTMVVALTVGLSVASRTVTNLKISKQNEESERAFQAAEAGIEQAIKSIRQSPVDANGVPIAFSNNSSATYDIKTTKGKQVLLNGGEDVDQDVGLDVWLSNYPDYSSSIANTTLTVYWGAGQNCSAGSGNSVSAALEVIVLSGAISNPTFTKYVYDACSRVPGATAPTAGNIFLNKSFQNQTSIVVTNGLIAKVIPLYNSSVIGIDSTVDLPSQGSQVDSVGRSGDTVRKVSFFAAYAQMPPEVFPYSMISQ